jgi:serine/threonine protein kinase/HEAT repeat protein
MSSQQAPTQLSRRCNSCGVIYPADEEHVCGVAPTTEAPTVAPAAEPAGRADAPTVDLKQIASQPTLSRAAQVEKVAQSDLVGLILGDRYEIQERLSAGGMGVVYKGRHIVLDSPIAVKILLKPQDTEAQRRFQQEAKLASLIRHPNTVYISDFGQLSDGRSYLVMEFLQGPTLSHVLRKGRLSVFRACQIARQIAEGLQAVHDKDIVHRDLKPENIFLIRDGQKEFVKIVDFGIALAAPALRMEKAETALLATVKQGAAGAEKATAVGADEGTEADAQARHTLPGTILGTPHYMSPEQASGDTVDARCDQYALGCILYEMLTGQVPFDHPTNVMSIMFKHISEAVEPPAKRCPEAQIPEEVQAIVMRTLAKSRDDRFATMGELAQALTRELAVLTPDESVQATEGPQPTTSLGGRLSTQVVLRPRRWQLLAVYAAMAALVLGMGALGFRQWRASQQLRTRQLSARELAGVRQSSLGVLGSQLRSSADSGQRELQLSALQTAGRTHELALRPLVEPLLRDPDGEVQALAAEALGQLGDRQAVTALATLLSETSKLPVKVAAATALDLLDDERGQRTLLQLLDGTDEVARFRAAYALAGKGNRKAVAVLSGLLERSHPPDEVMLDALTRLAQAGEDAARRQLLARLSTADQPQKRLPIAYRLAQLGEPSGRTALRELAETPGPQQLLAARLYVGPEQTQLSDQFRSVLRDPAASLSALLLAVDGLGSGGKLADIGLLQPRLALGSAERLRQAAAVAVLRLSALDPSVMSEQSLRWAQDALHDSSWVVRQAGATVLGEVESDTATTALQGLLKDSDVRVRKSVVRSLGRKKSRPALLALREALYDAEAVVREEALRGLSRVAKALLGKGELQVKQDVSSWLREVLTQGRPTEQVLARTALLKLGDESQRAALASLQASPDREARRLLVEQGEAQDGAAAAVVLLADADFSVRMSAARRLAEQGDGRSVAVLREALAKGGSESVMAFALLRRLGEQVPPPRELNDLLHGPDIAVRMQSVEALGRLPAQLAVPFLLDAARDSDRSVRRLVAETAAELPETSTGPAGLPVLRMLQQDVDASVRFQAAALLAKFGDLSRFQQPGAGASRPGSGADSDGVPRLLRPAAEPGPAAGEVPDAGVAEAPTDAGSAGDAGPVAVVSEPVIPASGDRQLAAIEEMARKGLAAFAAKDYGKALKLLNKAQAQCEHKKKLAAACAQLNVEMSVRIAQSYEKQDHLPEAMGEYEKALRLSATLTVRPALKSEAEAGQVRLRSQLGRVTMPKTVGGRCREETVWMLPGNNLLTVNGAETYVRVRVGEVQNLGSCP